MQVVILAGGLGTRLRPITQRIPKPMVEVGGRPFLEFIVEHLVSQSFDRFLFLLGYLGDQIRDHFGDGRRWGISILYATEPKPLGTGGAIRNALDQLDSEFLLLYGDSYLPIDYRAVVNEFHKFPSRSLMVVYDNHLGDTGVMNNVALDQEALVRRYEKGQLAPDLQYVEAGVLCLHRHVFADLVGSEPISLEQHIYAKLISNQQLGAYITKDRFFDIGTPERFSDFVAKRA